MIIDKLLKEVLDLVSMTKKSILMDLHNSIINERIIIYGTGVGGRRIYDILREMGYRSFVFTDSNPAVWGETIFGYDIISPEKIKKNDIVCIASYFNSIEIANKLYQSGIKNIVELFFLKLLDLKKTIIFLQNNIDNIKKVLKLLYDEKSKECYLKMLLFRLTLNPLYITTSPSDRRYFHPIVRPNSNDIVIDGGAYDGDTIEWWSKMGVSPKIIFAFDPDEINYLNLIKKYKTEKKIKPVKKGLYNKQMKLKFHGNSGSAGSLIREDGSESIEVISIDLFVKKNEISSIDLIKLDIEGAELKALMGAKHVLSEFSPKLQICLYHKTSDFIEIPLLINSINSNYDMYVEHHSHTLTETILYCKPKK